MKEGENERNGRQNSEVSKQKAEKNRLCHGAIAGKEMQKHGLSEVEGLKVKSKNCGVSLLAALPPPQAAGLFG